MKVTHHGDEHLICLSSEELALFVDMCHAAVFSDHLTTESDTHQRLTRFMSDVQSSLFEAAQTVWRRKLRVNPVSGS
jgi:hypothetical protein